MTNNTIEEEFRLTVPFFSLTIDFRHHETVRFTRLLVSQDFFEDVGMMYFMPFLNLRL
jgi:hypothetical protein